MEILEKRNHKNLYHDVKQGMIENVVGMDLELELPNTPNIKLCNDGIRSPEEQVAEILRKCGYNNNWQRYRGTS